MPLQRQILLFLDQAGAVMEPKNAERSIIETDTVFLPRIEYFVERKDSPNWSIITDVINFYDLTYICGGYAVYSVDGKDYPLKKGDLVFVAKGQNRQAWTDPDNPVHSYAFNFNIYTPEAQSVTLNFPTVFHIGSDPYFHDILAKVNKTWLEREKGFMFEASALLMLALHHIAKKYKAYASKQSLCDSRIDSIKQYILTNYSKRIYQRELADLVNLHPVYMGTLFNAMTGYTIKEYLNRIRVNKASDLLSEQELSVTQTAYLCGFDDVFYFSKVFKKYTGLSPTEWKAKDKGFLLNE